jgi:predicted permease
VVAQLALGLVLLNCGALLVRSYGNLRGTDQGFDQDHVLTMAVSLTGPEYDDVAERFTYFEDAKQTLATLPGVHHAGVTNKLPLRGGSNARTRSEDQPPRSGPVDGVLTEITPVIPDYFKAMGIPLLAGRTPTLEDTVSAHYGAVINQSLADRLWPGQNPIGRRFTFDENPPAWLTVVGVVGDVRQWGAEREPIPEAFTPYTFFPLERMYLTLGVDGDPAAVAGAARQRLFEIDPDSPTFQVRTMGDVLHASFERRRFYTFMTGLFAVLAVVLAAVGVFGVLSQYVTQRTHEIGLRAALGAARTEVLRLVVGRTLRMFAVGLAVGLIGMVMSRRLLAGMLYEVGGWDLAAIAVTVGVLAVVALLGSMAPALRATRVSPVVALRAE